MADVLAFIEQRKTAIRRAALTRFGAYAGTLPSRIAESLLKHVGTSRIAEGDWSSGSMLQSRSFALRNALAGIGPGTTAHSESSPRGVEASAGVDPNVIKYARIQELGGFIRSKGSMHKFFWARFIATMLPFYRIMALSVKKIGGVNIKAKPYMAPGTRDAIERAKREMPGEIAVIVLASWNS